MSFSTRKRRAQSDIRGSDAHSPPQRRRVHSGPQRSNNRISTSTNSRRARDEDDEEIEIDEEGQDVSDPERDQEQVTVDAMVKNMVRLALAHEYSRIPIRRADMSKVLGSGSRKFKEVFEKTQNELRNVFGMEMMELPMREKTRLTQRRAAQTTEKTTTSKTYILVSVLPHEYRIPEIMGPTTVKDASYQGLVAFVVALIYLNGRSIPLRNLDRYLRKMDVDEHSADRALQQMQKHGYIVKVKDSTADVGDVTPYDYHLGPRAKVEIGEDGLKRLVASVFGEDAPEDLNDRVQRTIGVELSNMSIAEDEEGGNLDGEAAAPTTTRKRNPGRGRRADDDDYE